MQTYLKVILKYDWADKQKFNYWIGKANVTIIKTKTSTNNEQYATILINDHRALNILLTLLNKECWWGVQVHKIKRKRMWWR